MIKNLITFVAALSCVLGAQAAVLDTSFDPGTGANGLVENSLVLPNGQILICGNFTTINGFTNSYVARLNANGSVDTSFNPQVAYWTRTMALQSNGKIIIAGFFTSVAGQHRGLIARLNANGSLDTTFASGQGANGVLGVAVDGDADPFIFATAIQSDGKIIITGNFTNYDGVNINGIARLNTDGSLDTTFNVGAGLNFASWGRSLLVQANGQIIVTGWFQSYDNQPYNRMVRLNSDGSADTTFNPFFGSLTAVYNAVELPNAQYVVVGDSQNTNGLFLQDMGRLDSNGTNDTTFLGNDNDKTESVRLLANGKLLISGYFSEVDGTPRSSVAILNADGSLDTNFAATVDNFIWSTAVQPDGRILVAGGFNTIDGVTRHSIARVFPQNISVTSVPSAGPVVRITSPAVAVPRYYTNVVAVAGTARSTVGLSAVYVDTSPGTVTSSKGTTNFSATLSLSPGTNIVTVTAVDTAGHSSTVTRDFIYAADEILSVTTTAGGTVLPNLNGRTLRAATAYAIAAHPAPGYVFNGWSGGVAAAAPRLVFIMQPGLSLTANFIPNPFVPYVGTYQGLVDNPEAVTNASSGFVVLTIAAGGNYSARLTLDGLTYSWSGDVSNTLGAVKIIPRRNQSSIAVSLQFGGDVFVSGTVTAGTFNSSFGAYNLSHPATNFTGLYTVSLPGGANGMPAGNGYLTINVNAKGLATIGGVLADGTTFVRAVPVGPDDSIPFYVAYKGNEDAVFGLIYLPFTGVTNASFVHWEMPQAGATTSVTGSSYSRGALNLLNNAVLTLSDGGLTAPISQTVDLSATGKFFVSLPNTNHIALSFNAANGVFSGTFIDPETRRLTGLHGVLLQQTGTAKGFFLSGGQSGAVSVSP